MKNIILSIMLILSICGISAQSFDNFMEQRGGEVIARMAHPMNTYESCSYQTRGNSILIKIEYKKCTTELKFYAIGDIFYNLEVLSDTDFYPPFRAVQNIKSILYTMMENEFPETIVAIEDKIGTKIREMDGKQLACMAFTLAWLNYKY